MENYTDPVSQSLCGVQLSRRRLDCIPPDCFTNERNVSTSSTRTIQRVQQYRICVSIQNAERFWVEFRALYVDRITTWALLWTPQLAGKLHRRCLSRFDRTTRARSTCGKITTKYASHEHTHTHTHTYSILITLVCTDANTHWTIWETPTKTTQKGCTTRVRLAHIPAEKTHRDTSQMNAYANVDERMCFWVVKSVIAWLHQRTEDSVTPTHNELSIVFTLLVHKHTGTQTNSGIHERSTNTHVRLIVLGISSCGVTGQNESTVATDTRANNEQANTSCRSCCAIHGTWMFILCVCVRVSLCSTLRPPLPRPQANSNRHAESADMRCNVWTTPTCGWVCRLERLRKCSRNRYHVRT